MYLLIPCGKPLSSGTTGYPSSNNGGTNDISSRCSTMWALNSASANPSSGDAIAIQIVANPARKQAIRQAGNWASRVLRIRNQPRT